MVSSAAIKQVNAMPRGRSNPVSATTAVANRRSPKSQAPAGPPADSSSKSSAKKPAKSRAKAAVGSSVSPVAAGKETGRNETSGKKSRANTAKPGFIRGAGTELLRKSKRLATTTPSPELVSKAKTLIETPIHYVDHPLFARRDCLRQIRKIEPAGLPPADFSESGTPSSDCMLLPSFARTRLLMGREEEYLFTLMNFLRFRAAKQVKKLKVLKPDLAIIVKIEADLFEATRVRNRIIQGNLRLVVSLSRKLARSPDQLADLVSEGVMPLMRAVELFDISRGNRFSTYATWAIRNQMHRILKRNQVHAEHTIDASDTGLEQLPDFRSDGIITEKHAAFQSEAVKRLLDNLTERERLVIAARYGLDGHPQGQSLSEISGRLGLSKERIRQIALKALEKLQAATSGGPTIQDLLG